MAQAELRKKVTKLDTVITSIDPLIDGKDSWIGLNSSSAITVVHSPIVPIGTFPAKVNGLHIVQHKKFPPTFNMVVGDYISRVRGNTLVAFARPGIVLNQDLSHLYRYADEQRMERTYGCYVMGKDGIPDFFVFTGNVAEFMFHAVHHTVMFSGSTWPIAVHAWAQRGLMKHRYFDATEMNVVIQPIPVEPVPEPVAEAPSIPDAPVTITLPEPEATAPVAKKRGRPRKTK